METYNCDISLLYQPYLYLHNILNFVLHLAVSSLLLILLPKFKFKGSEIFKSKSISLSFANPLLSSFSINHNFYLN